MKTISLIVLLMMGLALTGVDTVSPSKPETLTYDDLQDASVTICRPENKTPVGSGVVITTKKGVSYVWTAAHVILDETPFGSVEVQGLEIENRVNGVYVRQPANIVAYDEKLDLAVLRLTKKVKSNVAWSFDLAKPGQKVVTIGCPLGRFDDTISQGIVSSGRVLKENFKIQTSCPIYPGNSGGGVFDGDGGLIGIVVSRYFYDYGKPAPSLTFHVPNESAKKFARENNLTHALGE